MHSTGGDEDITCTCTCAEDNSVLEYEMGQHSDTIIPAFAMHFAAQTYVGAPLDDRNQYTMSNRL